VGLSRKECIETWLEVVASEATPGSAAERIASVLQEEGDVPNLDYTIAKCLQQEAIAQSKKYACAGTLLRNVPIARRPRIVWKYIENIGVFEQGEANNFNEIRDNLFRGQKLPYDPAFAELLLKTAERRSAGTIRAELIYIYSEYTKPTPRAIEHLIALAREPRLTRLAAQGITILVDKGKDDALRVTALGELRRLREQAHFMRMKYGADPREALDDAIRRLDRVQH
jgi:hypothetical protein